MGNVIKSIFVILSVMFMGCSNSSSETDLFRKKINLKHHLLIDSLADPCVIEVSDTLLFLSNYKTQPLIEVYGISGKVKGKFVEIGKEQLQIVGTGDIQSFENGEKIVINDLFSKKLLVFNQKEFLQNNLSNGKVVYVENDKTEGFDKLMLTKNHIIAESRSPNGRLILMDTGGTTKGYFLSYPRKELVNTKLDQYSNAALYGSALVYNQKAEKMALATYCAGILNIVAVGENSLDSLWSYSEFFPSGVDLMLMGENLVVVHNKDALHGYLDIAASDKFVYALYSGKKINEDGYYYSSTIRVFSWSADSFFEFILDEPIKRLTVSSDDRYIYGISSSKAGSAVVSYNIENFYAK